MMRKFFNRNWFATLSSKDYMNLQEQYGCHNYAPLPAVLERGEGIYMYDVQGKKYFDFVSAYSAVNQGHCHPKILKTFVQQATKLTLTSRAVYNNRLGSAEKKMHEMFGYDKSLFMNSGVQAGQSAVKFARRWGYNKKQIPDNTATVLFAKGNFWGRTIAACGSSDDPERFRKFGPFQGLKFQLIDYGCINSLEKALKQNPSIVAYMVQPIQGEKGVVLPPPGYLKKVHEILKKYNALLICDQIQTGLGRTGKMLCVEHQGVRPDMILLGKALSGGFYPVSAVLADNQVMNNINPGQHGSTYGGNPLGVQTAMTALDVIVEEGLVENSARMGEKFMKQLKQIINGDQVKEIRGKGLFVGAQFRNDTFAKELSYKMLEHGLLAKPTQKSIIRFSPPLIIKERQIEQSLTIIQKAWKHVTSK